MFLLLGTVFIVASYITILTLKYGRVDGESSHSCEIIRWEHQMETKYKVKVA